MQNIRRRPLLLAGLAAPWSVFSATEADPVAALRRGGVAAIFRHAEAPGTYDPPGMVLSDCSTQRNLDDKGRAQARRLGAWFQTHGLRPARVRSSPWCRCAETAQLALGPAEIWAPLGSPSQSTPEARQAQGRALQQALREIPAQGFEVWVTHNFVISDLVGVSTASAEGLVVRGGERALVVARMPPP
jgi:phosphohistidine phosphatase SixA